MTDMAPAQHPATDEAGLTAALDRLDTINRQLAETARRGGEGAGAAIVSLRYDFATECGNLLLAMCDDERVFGQRELFAELQTGLDTLRSRVTNHQLRWQGDKIEHDQAGYSEAAGHLNAAVTGFIAHCRAAIDG